MNKHMIRQAVNVVAVLATIVVNALANILPLNGLNTGEISDRFKVFFVPAGYVFSIWGLIYLGLIGFAVYQALPAQRENPRLLRMGYLFALSCAANIAWLFLWHYEQFALTLVAMFALLGLLIAIYLVLGIGKTSVSNGEKWLVRLLFSVYLGWISVATIANVTSTLDYVQWSGWGVSAQAWAVIMLVVGVVVAGLMAFTRGEVAFLLVLVWAFAGIGVKQATFPLVSIAAYVAAVLVVALLIASRLMRRRILY
jgi:benzodiazapine receptor